MRIGPELYSLSIDKPVHCTLAINIPEVTIGRDAFYGDWDLNFVFNSALIMNKYEYGYTLKVAVLGFGFEIWIAKNLN
jgi:hypothetical protein